MKNFKSFVQENRVRIPLIQRDYVQGADKNNDKRDKFLCSLLSALKEGKEYPLDFIYGSTNTEYFEPLDGQQRITTLFLLYYVLKQVSQVKPESKIDEQISQFTYVTRNSSTAFCQNLFAVGQKLELGDMPSKCIKNQSWFCEEWLYDPTIKAMLEMLDAIMNQLNSDTYKWQWDIMAHNLYGKQESLIQFECLNIGDYNLDDSLYVKMNARGKQLTDFENWKADFIKYLETKWKGKEYNGCSIRTYFEQHIEHEWTDMLWPYALKINEDAQGSEYPLTDSLFMNLYDYLLQMIFFAKMPKIDGKDVTTDDFAKYKETILDNLTEDELHFLFQALDFFTSIKSNAFFDDLFYLDGTLYNEKVRLFGLQNTNLFELCITADKTFTVKMQVLLYCILLYAIKYTIQEVNANLTRYTRVCRNLIESIWQVQRLSIVSNVRLTDMAKYKRVIEQLIAHEDIRQALANISDETTGFGDIKLEKNKIQALAIEDLPFIRGCLKELDPQQLSQNQEKVHEALLAFENQDNENAIIRLLVSNGFTGYTFGWCRRGMRYFFGRCGSWDVLFFSKNETFKIALQKYIQGYIDGKNIDAQLKDIVIPIEEDNAFNHYVLKYPQCIYSENAANYNLVSIAEDNRNSFDYIVLSSNSGNPLMAYHLDIFTNAVWQILKERLPQGTNLIKRNWAIYSESNSGICIAEKWTLICRKEGWHITYSQTERENMPECLQAKYDLTQCQENDKEYLLMPNLQGNDRVETAVEFTSDYLKEAGLL